MNNVNVYVTHNNNQRLDAAERFLQGNGKMYNFTEGRKNIFHFDTLIREIDTVMKTMSPNDYLLIAGNLVISSIVTAYVYDQFKRVKCLVWNYNEQEYIEEVLNFNQ